MFSAIFALVIFWIGFKFFAWGAGMTGIHHHTRLVG
jgi:hypothetical protein